MGKVTTDEAARKDRKDDLTKWFNMQAALAPAKCENCGGSLTSTIKFHPRAHICHIVPKTPEGGCPSVATHPLNRWFGCKNCHDAYDSESPEVVATMAVIPVCKARLKVFYPLIAADEVRRVPAFLLQGPQSEELPEIQVEHHVKQQKNAGNSNKGGKKQPVKRAGKKNG